MRGVGTSGRGEYVRKRGQNPNMPHLLLMLFIFLTKISSDQGKFIMTFKLLK
jgi:hypothetical protein